MTKMLIALLIFTPLMAFPQQDNTLFDSTYRAAWHAYKAKEYKTAIALYEKSLTFPAAKDFLWQFHFTMSCCYSLEGNADSAFSHLDQAIGYGLNDSYLISGHVDFAPLRKLTPVRFAAAVAKADSIFHTARVNESPIAITSYDNYDGPADISQYCWDDFHHPMMDSLRKKYSLEEIAAPGKTEFERMRRMLHWVTTRFEHSGTNGCKGSDALAILADAERGSQMRCVEYGKVFANCMDALGYPARTVGLTKFGTGFGPSLGHVGAEVWSNQYGKWIFFDGQNDAWWEAGGIPLSAEECRALLLQGRDSEVVFTGDREDGDYAEQRLTWFPYFYHLGLGNSFSFFDTASYSRARYAELMDEAVVPELFSQGRPNQIPLTTDRQYLYPELNRTTIHLRHVNAWAASDTLNVHLSHTMPWFKKFRVRINGGQWKDSESDFTWVLDKGGNVIEAKGVNAAGVEGRVSVITLRNNIR